MPNSALPPNLQGKRHNDYPWGLRWIPRGWTAFKWGKPHNFVGYLNTSDFIWVGNEGFTRPITAPGTWQVSRFPDGPWYAWYFAFTTKGGTHFRIGARWDDVDDYVEFPTTAIKRGVGILGR